jgi:hypothetical protein
MPTDTLQRPTPADPLGLFTPLPALEGLHVSFPKVSHVPFAVGSSRPLLGQVCRLNPSYSWALGQMALYAWNKYTPICIDEVHSETAGNLGRGLIVQAQELTRALRAHLADACRGFWQGR